MCVLYISKTKLTIFQSESASTYTYIMIWLMITTFQLPRPKTLCISYISWHNQLSLNITVWNIYVLFLHFCGWAIWTWLSWASASGSLYSCNHSISRCCTFKSNWIREGPTLSSCGFWQDLVLHGLLVWGLQFLTGCWPGLPLDPWHVTSHSKASCFIGRVQAERAQ